MALDLDLEIHARFTHAPRVAAHADMSKDLSKSASVLSRLKVC